jgi:hypothetical protein
MDREYRIVWFQHYPLRRCERRNCNRITTTVIFAHPIAWNGMGIRKWVVFTDTYPNSYFRPNAPSPGLVTFICPIVEGKLDLRFSHRRRAAITRGHEFVHNRAVKLFLYWPEHCNRFDER